MNASYRIKFIYADQLEPQVRSYKAASPGQAFKKCLRKYPGAKLIEGRKEGGLGGNYGCITYTPPPTVRIIAEPAAPKAEETKFPFYDDCLGRRPFKTASQSARLWSGISNEISGGAWPVHEGRKAHKPKQQNK